MCSKCARPYKLKKYLLKHEETCNLTQEKINEIKNKYLLDSIGAIRIAKEFNLDSHTVGFILKDLLRNRSDSIKLSHKFNPRKLSEETKKIIGESRSKYLKQHPEKVPYRLYHSSKKNWIEEHFKEELERRQIDGWVHKYCCGIYEYDFAFPFKKIDIEIDGPTHDQEKVKQIDFKRDEWSRSQGWKILRFKASHVKHEVKKCIDILEDFLEKNKVDQIYVNEKFHELQLSRHMEKEKKLKQIENLKKIKKQEKDLKNQEQRRQLIKLICEKQIEKNQLIEQKQIQNKIIIRKKINDNIEHIDVTKIGWINLLSHKLEISHTQVRRLIKKYFPELKCRIVKRKDEFRKQKDKEFELRKETVIQKNKEKIIKILHFFENYDFNKKQSLRSLTREINLGLSHKFIKKFINVYRNDKDNISCFLNYHFVKLWYRW
jgi:very-short-patch-repair endonuclease